LRHLKQSIWDFGRLFSDIPQKYKDIPELMVDLLSVFISFSFEIKGGRIIPDQIKNLMKNAGENSLTKGISPKKSCQIALVKVTIAKMKILLIG
jgi:hypothetical protein